MRRVPRTNGRPPIVGPDAGLVARSLTRCDPVKTVAVAGGALVFAGYGRGPRAGRPPTRAWTAFQRSACRPQPTPRLVFQGTRRAAS